MNRKQITACCKVLQEKLGWDLPFTGKTWELPEPFNGMRFTPIATLGTMVRLALAGGETYATLREALPVRPSVLPASATATEDATLSRLWPGLGYTK